MNAIDEPSSSTPTIAGEARSGQPNAMWLFFTNQTMPAIITATMAAVPIQDIHLQESEERLQRSIVTACADSPHGQSPTRRCQFDDSRADERRLRP